MKPSIKWSEFFLENYSRKHRVPFFLLPNREFGVVNSSTEFYALLIRGIRQSRFRINLSTLYFGSGPLEQFMFREILDASNRNQQLKISLTVDKNRGERGSHSGGPSSEDLFRDLMLKALNPQNLTLTLFQHSDVSRRSLWGGAGAREVFGTFHVKHYMFDDSVILSGANLSEEYLTTRYDRYLYVNDDKDFCDFLEDFDRVCIDSGDRLSPSGTMREGWEAVKHLKEGLHRQFSVYLFNAYSEKRLAEALAKKQEEERQLAGHLEGTAGPGQTPPPTSLGSNNPDPSHEFSDKCTQLFKSVKEVEQLPFKVDTTLEFFRKKYEDFGARKTQGTSFVFPAFQLALINYRVEEQLILGVFQHLFNADPTQQYELTFTTGYFNPSDQLLELFRTIPANVSLTILTAAPSCNSFFQARGLKGSVPAMYRIALRNWLTAFADRPNVRFLEFTKPGSTYHAKGLWLRCVSDPRAEYLTVYGSSNFSNRSFHRDLENQFYLVTRDSERIADFEEERLALLSHGRPVTLAEVNADPATPIGLLQRGLYRLFSNAL